MIRPSKLAMIVTAVVLLTAAIPVGAADDSAPVVDLTKLSLEDLVNIEVSSASKRSEKISSAPASAFVITREDIRRYGYRNITDALRRIVGLYGASDRNYEYVGIRGFARPGDYNTRLLLLIDGHRMNDPIYDYAMVGEDLPIDIENVERIEVIKGPGSALWGTNAVLAVINILTRNSDADGLSLVEDYSTFDRKRMFLGYGATLNNGLKFRASVSGLNSDGESRIYYPEFDDPSNNNGLAEGVDGEEVTRRFLTASFKNLNLIFASGSRTKYIPTASYGSQFNNSNELTIDDRSFLELNSERVISKERNGSLFARLYYDRYYYNGNYPYDEGEGTVALSGDYAISRSWGAEVRYTQDISSRLSSAIGIEYLKANKMRQWGIYGGEPYLDISSSLGLKSTYAQTDFAATKSLRLVTGVRVDHYSTFGSHWSPRMALIYEPAGSTTLKLLYGEAFRAPNAYEREYQSTATYMDNLNLKPEMIHTYELVWEKELGRRNRLVTSLFEFHLEDIITQTPVSGDRLQFQNQGTIQSRGIEAQFESRLKNGSTSHLGFTLLKARSTQYGWISNSPKMLATWGTSIPVSSNKFYVTPEIQFVGKRKTLADNYVSSSAVMNLVITKANLSDRMDVSIGVYNLFNESTYTPASEEFVQDRIPQIGRTLRLRISQRF